MTTSIMISGINVDYAPFYRVHLKTPKGLGEWAFRLGKEVKFYYGKYAEARKQAIAEAKRKGLISVFVLS